MLNKLLESYTPFTSAMDENWKDYTYADLSNTIYKVTHYLKTDLLKIFHTVSNANSGKVANPNKQHQLDSTSTSFVLSLICQNPICLSKKQWHTPDKCCELHLELRPTYCQQHSNSTGIKIKKVATLPPPNIPTINLSWLPKILAITTFRYDFWLLDSTANIYVCNNRNLFIDFVEKSTRLSGVTLLDISLGWGTVTFLFVLEDGQARAQIQMTNILYIPQSPASLIILHKLNNARLYWDNKSWHLYNNNDDKKVVGYTSK